jgi:uncharacterized membrane protein
MLCAACVTACRFRFHNREISNMGKSRLEAFSDGVIIIIIMMLELKVP